MKYKAIIETDDYKDFEFFEDGNGKYMVGKDASATASGGWIPLYLTECKQDPCEDCISRQAVLDLPRRTMKNYFGEVVGETVYVKDIMELSSVASQYPVLDKIRAEIEEHAKINQHLNTDRARALCWCLDVIDKYKVESEEI